MKKYFYLTTPLYYVNDRPHIGHAYTTIAADVLARWKRLSGSSVFFLTGTDEHGSKIEEAARAHQTTPIAYADKIAGSFQDAWKTLNISYDDFIRTTDLRHVQVVQAVFAQLHEKKLIEEREYEGWYCVACESFWLESDLKDGRCPDCGRSVQKLKEKNYFFKLSQFTQPLLDYFKAHPEFLSGRFGAEMQNFVAQGLKDISVTRQNVPWGIAVPRSPDQTIYVWFDALINYITAAGFPPAVAHNKAAFDEIWPCDVHFVGKEIYRFHTITWTAMLLALGLPLPKRVIAHGWWTVENEKMSKSKGNVVDPLAVAQEYGVDALRYFLLREIPFGADGDYSAAAFKKRYNSELANDLGNLFSRVLNLVEKNCGDVLRKPRLEALFWAEAIEPIAQCYERADFSGALEKLMTVVRTANAKIEEAAPWKLAKENPAAAEEVLADLALCLAWLAAGFYPFMPAMCEKMWQALALPGTVHENGKAVFYDALNNFSPQRKLVKCDPFFPRKQ